MRNFTLLMLLLIIATSGFSQDQEINPEAIEQYKEECRQLVGFLEGTLNFLGDSAATVQEKEVVINQSYAKIFRDAEVQVEDDLDENRETLVNKDIQAYLKDVDFFFKTVVFRFDIQQIEQFANADGALFFKVSLVRQLEGITVQNDTVSNSRERFVEINLDPFKKDLKIVSFYTTKLNEKEELRNWWNTMAFEWRTFFGENVLVYDTLPVTDILHLSADAFVALRPYTIVRNDSFMIVDQDTLQMAMRDKLFGHKPDTIVFLNDTTLQWLPDTIPADLSPVYAQLRSFTKLKEINIAYKTHFTDLEPISQLTELQLINFSNTPIDDIAPLRNLNKLEAIYFSNTQVSDLNPLQYSINIRELYAFNTPLRDLETMRYLRQLEKLYCFNTAVEDLAPLSALKNLTALRLSGTMISDLQPLSKLENLQLLDVSNTKVSDIEPLSKMQNLQLLNLDHTAVVKIDAIKKLQALAILQMSYTGVNSLEDLKALPKLTKIYCDHSKITGEQALEFMRERPEVLVIYETEALKDWWESLPIYWRAILAEQSGISSNPRTEELHQIINLKALNLSDNSYLQQLEPISRLSMLEQLWLPHTEITDLSPLSGLVFLKLLDVSNTRVADLRPLSNLQNLETLNIANSRVESLEPLNNLGQLKLVNADESRVVAQQAQKLKAIQPNVLIIYQTKELQMWWGNLPEAWRAVFADKVPVNVNPNAQQLHQIADLKEIEIEGSDFVSLLPLGKLPFLEKLRVNASAITDLSPLSDKKWLKQLQISGSPVVNLQPLSGLKQLEVLNIESTPISDLSPLEGLTNLKVLNAGGTQIKSLKPLAGLHKLEEVSIFNTRVKKLSPVDQLPALKHFKCYNTRLRAKDVEALKRQKPELNVLFY
jgi:Leucine-rich repeat (LRR) protein/arsenate reductase-like glutaredoxin family protein